MGVWDLAYSFGEGVNVIIAQVSPLVDAYQFVFFWCVLGDRATRMCALSGR